jgi:hypothetical protein
VALLAIETSTREATVARGDATLRIKGAKDRATLAEREALEWVSRAEVENNAMLTSVHEGAEVLARKMTLLEDELTREHRAQETSEREHRACFEELTLLQTQGSELCHAIVGPPRAKHLSEGMQLVALHHTEMAGELAAFQATVSSAAESVLGRLPSNTMCMEVVGDLVAECQKVEGHRSKFERPTAGICDLLLGPPPGQAWLGDRLDEASG